jgi:hypothetical protein
MELDKAKIKKMIEKSRKLRLRTIKTSMLYWYPKTYKLKDIPQPKTKFILLGKKDLDARNNEGLTREICTKVQKSIDKHFKLPVFLRSDLTSGKHSWKKTCYFDGTGELSSHLLELTIDNLLKDLWFYAFVVREYIPMATKFTAFWGEMPIGSERRYFVNNGKVIAHCSYWPEEAFDTDYVREDLPDNWRDMLTKLNSESYGETGQLTRMSEAIGKVLPGFWSIDFCLSKDGQWIFIDAAEGNESWAPDYLREELYEKVNLKEKP